jgi:hypothetical protein
MALCRARLFSKINHAVLEVCEVRVMNTLDLDAASGTAW